MCLNKAAPQWGIKRSGEENIGLRGYKYENAMLQQLTRNGKLQRGLYQGRILGARKDW